MWVLHTVSEGRFRGLNDTLTSPWWASEEHSVLRYLLVTLRDDVEAVALNKEDLFRYTVDFCIPLGTLELFGVLLYCKDSLPAAGQGESNSIAASTTKCVNDDSL